MSREVARAVRDAMPPLQTAERASLLAIDPDRQGHIHGGANAAASAAHLIRHGVHIVVTEISSGGKSVTDILLAHAAKLGPHLLVMGANGRPPLLEFVLGGTTQALLEPSTVPVLMSHYVPSTADELDLGFNSRQH